MGVINFIKSYIINRKIKKLETRQILIAQLVSMARMSNNGEAFQSLQKQYRDLEGKISELKKIIKSK